MMDFEFMLRPSSLKYFMTCLLFVCFCCFVLLGTSKILSLGEFDKCNLLYFYYLFLTWNFVILEQVLFDLLLFLLL